MPLVAKPSSRAKPSQSKKRRLRAAALESSPSAGNRTALVLVWSTTYPSSAASASTSEQPTTIIPTTLYVRVRLERMALTTRPSPREPKPGISIFSYGHDVRAHRHRPRPRLHASSAPRWLATLPCRPTSHTSSEDDLLRELAVYDGTTTGTGDGEGIGSIRSSYDDVHKQLLRHCSFFAERSPHSIDFLLEHVTYAEMRSLIESCSPSFASPPPSPMQLDMGPATTTPPTSTAPLARLSSFRPGQVGRRADRVSRLGHRRRLLPPSRFFVFKKDQEDTKGRPEPVYVAGSVRGADLDRLCHTPDRWQDDYHNTMQLWLTR
ncbi:hypothetical protein BU26DRAFT_511531 [Trematosphaeria pertusa]|uniref:Uncharacterized protein n=1 Tax=Trematosphaeria pertusa TaxID=390896 RepID=A0A6A6HTF8_9PLEO|nr:uncharacterized protein BU26DRAFT_511531 [Trematosphaeria pertusa]KAF2241455.1 hypothetical protein BU26DRAFT_511531 [Trematosphaeria pertusa]